MPAVNSVNENGSCTIISLGFFPPELMEIDSADAVDLEKAALVTHFEPSSPNEDIDLRLEFFVIICDGGDIIRTIGFLLQHRFREQGRRIRDDAVLCNSNRFIGDELDIRLLQSWIIIIEDERSFTSKLVVRGQFSLQNRILDRSIQMSERNFGHLGLSLCPAIPIPPRSFLLEVEVEMVSPQEDGKPREPPYVTLGPRFISTRENVRGTSLEESELLDDGLDFRCDLGCARTGSDHGDAFAGQINVVAPLRCMPDFPFERFRARNIGVFGTGELTTG
jgi:hypothetical protein